MGYIMNRRSYLNKQKTESVVITYFKEDKIVTTPVFLFEVIVSIQYGLEIYIVSNGIKAHTFWSQNQAQTMANRLNNSIRSGVK